MARRIFSTAVLALVLAVGTRAATLSIPGGYFDGITAYPIGWTLVAARDLAAPFLVSFTALVALQWLAGRMSGGRTASARRTLARAA